jgi:hypothetical protein
MYAVPFAMTLAACGGGDDGKTVALVDASSTTKKDAPTTNPTPDAPTTAALSGLGQTCSQTQACPSTAMQCLTSQGATTGFCSLVCHAGATFMTDTNAQPTDPNLGTTAADTTKCSAVYSGGASGAADCDVPVNLSPAPVGGALAKNQKYTYDSYCGIDCGGTMAAPTCPGGLTCNQGLCTP